MRNRTRKDSGFGLVQMGILLVVAGIIISTLVPALVSRIQKDRMRYAMQSIRAVRDEVMGVVITDTANRRLPVPDTSGADPVLPASMGLSIPTDPWGNTWVYYLANDGSSGLSLSASSVQAAPSTDLQVNDRGTTHYSVAFVLVSPGPNHIRETTFTDNAFPLKDEVRIWSLGEEVPPGGAMLNDDVVEYVTLSYLKTRF